MVESDPQDMEFAEMGQPLELHHFYDWNDYTEEDPECDEEKAQENADIVEGELESLSAILSEKEYEKVEEIDTILAQSSQNSLKDVLHVMNLSIVPNFDNKILAKDKAKNITLELRKFPAIELTIIMVKAYPSSKAPLIALKGPFYQPYKSTIMEGLKGIWAEECPAIYEMVCHIQDEIIPAILEQYPDDFIQDGEGNVTMEFSDSALVQKISQSAADAFRREFDNEEHTCDICTRNLLGDKFTFLSSCEHYYSTECLREMVITKINEGKVGQIICAAEGCGKNLNDMDIKNIGLDAEMM